jgi:hypothetical protein
VETGAASSASILFANSNLLTMGANSEREISTGQTASGSRGVDPTLLADVSDLTLHKTGVGEVAALGGLRASGDSSPLQLVTPRNTRVRSDRPHLMWTATGDFESYTVTVLSDAGPVWSATTEGTMLNYPADAPALDPSLTYYWKVEGEEMLDVTQSELVSFQVLSAERLEALKQAEANIKETFGDAADAASRDYMLGSLYAKEGLSAEAITAFKRIAATHGDSAFVQEILGKLYYETGEKDLSIAALQRAVELGQAK